MTEPVQIHPNITQLAHRAGFDWYCHSGRLLPGGNNLENLQQFAELLVRECAKVVEYEDSRAGPASHICILKHFGVKYE